MSQQAENIKVPILLSVSICCSLSLRSAGRILWAAFSLPLLSLFRQWWWIWKLWRRNPSMCAYQCSWMFFSVCVHVEGLRSPPRTAVSQSLVRFLVDSAYFWLLRDVKGWWSSLLWWIGDRIRVCTRLKEVSSFLAWHRGLCCMSFGVSSRIYYTLQLRRLLKRDYMYNAWRPWCCSGLIA